MRRAVAAVAVTSGIAVLVVARAELRRMLRARAGRRKAEERLRGALKADAWMTTALFQVSRRMADGERPVSLTVLADDGEGVRRAYTARDDSGQIVVTVRRAER